MTDTRRWMEAVAGLVCGPRYQSTDLERHQSEAVSRLVDMMLQFGGAVLADAVGLGKTRTALHAAVRLRRRVGGSLSGVGEGQNLGPIVLCVPSRLKVAWEQASSRLGLGADEVVVMTHARMSRGDFANPVGLGSVVVVDEAHRFRNPLTRRAQALEGMCEGAYVLLVTATPVVNTVWDFYHLLRLFLADHDTLAWTGMGLRDAFEAAERGAGDLTELLPLFTVRREEGTGVMGMRPSVAMSVLRYEPGEAERWLWQHLEREIRDMNFVLLRGDWPQGLFVDHVLRTWEGGGHALLCTLENLAEFHGRWLELDACGRRLERFEFNAIFGEQASQAVMPFMFAELSGEAGVDRDLVEADWRRLTMLGERTRATLDERGGVVSAVADLVRDGEKCLIFATFQRAAEGTFAALCVALGAQARVGLVTGAGARATGLGRTSAEEVLRRFAPRAHGVELPEHHDLQVLVCTDCLAEGVNLQDCSRVVFLDLPWTPQGVEQRVGRLMRAGGVTDVVRVYLPRPHTWNDTLGMRHRLSEKVEHAHRTGARFQTLSPTSSSLGPLAALTRLERLRGESEVWPGHVRGISPTWERWVVLRVLSGGHRRVRVVRQVAGGREFRLEKLIPPMVEWMARPVETDEVDEPEWAVALGESIRMELQAAAHAPVQLTQTQWALWRRLKDELREFDQGQWDALRAQLLRPLTRSQQRQLEAIQDRPVLEILRHVGRWPSFDPRVEVEVLATLELTGGPLEGSTAEDVHVQVKHRLTGGFAIVDHEAVSGEVFGLGDFGGDDQHVTEEEFVFLGGVEAVGQELLWDNEDVCGCGGVDVSEGDAEVVFVDLVGGDFAADDFTEDGV